MSPISLAPVWLEDIVGSLLVLLLSLAAFGQARRLVARDRENALYLFFYWLCLALMLFGVSRVLSHLVGRLLLFAGQDALWRQLRPYSGGLNAILSISIASITLFFHHIQKLYRRMQADHQHLAQTSKEILALNREMEALVMERTMSEMALGIADGIRNPLHIIGGFSQRLLRKAVPEDPARPWAEAIAKEAKRLESMVTRFETLARRKETLFTQEDLNVVVRETLDLVLPEAEDKGLHLLVSYAPTPVFGRMNKHLVKVALTHLVRNAIEATPPGGEIHCRTAEERHRAVLIIEDTGRGMPPEVVEKVFVPFYTTKLGGTGLGMVFVRQIVEEHRGVINLESREGRGTTVTIRLPLRAAESDLPPEAPEVEPGPAPPKPG